MKTSSDLDGTVPCIGERRGWEEGPRKKRGPAAGENIVHHTVNWRFGRCDGYDELGT